MVYEWKRGIRFDADAQAVGQELEEVKHRNAEGVLKFAERRTKSELHKCFEWDDSKAAENHRLDQARLVLRGLVTVITSESDKGEPVEVRFRTYEAISFESDDEKTKVYVPTPEALSDDTMRAQVFGRLNRIISDAERTAEAYTYLAPPLKVTREKLREARESVPA